MKFTEDVDEVDGATNPAYDVPQEIYLHSVEGFREVVLCTCCGMFSSA